jgi:hypothetical protein
MGKNRLRLWEFRLVFFIFYEAVVHHVGLGAVRKGVKEGLRVLANINQI